MDTSEKKMKKYIDLKKYGRNQSLRKRYFEPASIQHPAKMDLPLCRWIIDKFCHKNESEIILDPMAGIGSTLIMGLLMRPNSLFFGVELEQKFVDMPRANIKKVETIAKKDMFMKIGRAVVVQGDARELEKILREKVDKIITSPPFKDTQRKGTFMQEKCKRTGRDPNAPGMRGFIEGKPNNPQNIANLSYGKMDKIISSPPFGQAQSGGGIAKKGYDGPKHTSTDLVGKRSYMPENMGGKENIGNLPYGQADKIVTSPPFGGKVQHKTNYLGRQKRESGFEYSDNPENIGNMPHGQIDKVISSPPYQEGIGHGGKRKKKAVERSKGLWAQGRDSYSKSKNNIGSLTGKTYLNQMLLVYQQCLKILKPGGLMILITKDFIRDKKRVSLGEDTIKLCQAAGFTLKEIYYRKIEHPSFWRILYQQKYPSVEKIDSEDILVFKKP